MDRRNFLRRAGAVALVPIVGIKPVVTPDEFTEELLLSHPNRIGPASLKPGECVIMVNTAHPYIQNDARGIACARGFWRDIDIRYTEPIEIHGGHEGNPSFIPGRLGSEINLRMVTGPEGIQRHELP